MNWTGFRIWLYTALLNGLFVGIAVGIIDKEVYFALAGLVTAVLGLFITAPLLFLIIPIVKLSGKLPYSINAKLIWLIIMLIIVAILCMIGLGSLINGAFLIPETALAKELIVSLSLAVAFAVWFERNNLKRKYGVERQ